jgi:hypothetical protein
MAGSEPGLDVTLLEPDTIPAFVADMVFGLRVHVVHVVFITR